MPALFEKSTFLQMKGHPTMTEEWLKSMICQDPSILGLGPLLVRDKERRQPSGGRLDLLLESSDGEKRFEVELQLGSTDEKHIIRTIEYWDIERKRYPHFEHCAVIVAESITARFLNVVSLFNGHIPLIALQAKALAVRDFTSLIFTTVLEEVNLGLVGEEEELSEQADRSSWEDKVGIEILRLCDHTLSIINKVCAGFSLNYTKYYIGLFFDGKPRNFITIKPRRKYILLQFKMPQSEDVDESIINAGLELDSYEERYKQYRIKVEPQHLKLKEDFLAGLVRRAYES